MPPKPVLPQQPFYSDPLIDRRVCFGGTAANDTDIDVEFALWRDVSISLNGNCSCPADESEECNAQKIS